MADNQVARIAVLEEKVQTLEEVYRDQSKSVKVIQLNVTELVAGIKMLKWLLVTAIAAGPMLGVTLSRFIGSE